MSRFISFEGGEGVGKSTMIRRLSAHFDEIGVPHIVTREPGGTPLAERVRSLILSGVFRESGPEAEAIAFAAARAIHFRQLIYPTLYGGTWVLCDRFFDSTRAYQAASGLDPEMITILRQEAVGDFYPDLTLILDLPAAATRARLAARGDKLDRFEGEELAFHDRLRQNFLDIAVDEPGRCRVIDADRPVDDVYSSVLVAVLAAFPTLS